MKKIKLFAFVLSAMCIGVAHTAASPASEKSSAPGTEKFSPARNVTFMVSSKAGGNSDLFSRSIADIIAKKGLANQPVLIQNNAEGNGQISRHDTSGSKTPNESLLCMSSGDLTVMVTLGGLSINDFRPIAIMGADKHLVLTGKAGRYKTMEEAIKAAKDGKQVTIGGTPGDELVVLNMMLKELNLVDKFDFVSFGSSAETVTALMGGHVDLGMGKPAAAKAYVLSGDIKPLVALSTTRFAAPFDSAPTLSELGYKNVEYPLYRGLVGAKKMSDEALAYWDAVMGKVAESQEWKDYLTKNLLVPDYYNAAQTTERYQLVEQQALQTKK